MDREQRIKELKELRKEANRAYRIGEPIISDPEYDAIEEELDELIGPDDPYWQETYIEESDERKERLPYVMASLNKIKTVDGLKKWAKLKGIPEDAELVLSPKYDGLSLCVKEAEERAWTGGQDGITGRRSDKHFQLIVRRKELHDYLGIESLYTIGEVIMTKGVFASKYATKYFLSNGKNPKNARNLVAGLINADDPREPLTDTFYIRYSTSQESLSKVEQLNVCNLMNVVQVPYRVHTIDQISESYLKELFDEWSKDFEIDGIVIDVNSAVLRNKLGRETHSENPCYARAYKGNFEQVAENVPVLSLRYEVSKQGDLIPTAQIQPTQLDGVTVSNPTCNNAKFVKLMGLGTGATITIKRSGMVIPLIMKVNKMVEPELPTRCPSCGEPVEWGENNVHLVCTNPDCPAQALQRIVAFFEILKVDNVGEGVCTQLYNAGYDTIKKILDMSVADMMKIGGFAKKKSETVYQNIHRAITNVPLSKLQHASSCFRTLGSRKLALVEHFGLVTPKEEEITAIFGFAEKSAKQYIYGLEKFRNFIEGLPVKFTAKEEIKVEGERCKGMTAVFTGFRSDALKNAIIKESGNVVDSVTGKTTHLIMKKKGSGSSKEEKAISMGITILTADELAKTLGVNMEKKK